MHAGVPLTDNDRAPWLASLHRIIARAVGRREHLVVACSALREQYRRVLRDDLRPVRFVYLRATEQALGRRLAERVGHFAGPALLNSQLATLEEPADALAVDAEQPPTKIVDAIRYEFGL